jgi:internalin A
LKLFEDFEVTDCEALFERLSLRSSVAIFYNTIPSEGPVIPLNERIDSLDFLVYFKDITQVTIIFANISDIDVLKELPELSHLNISGNFVSDISAIRQMPNLRDFVFARNNVTDISHLEVLAEFMREFNISYNPVSDISVIEKLNNLFRVTISGTNVTDISPLSTLTNLVHVVFSDTNVRDFSPLYDSGISHFVMSDAGLTNADLVNIASIETIREIELDRNSISDLSLLNNIRFLEALQIDDNQIVTLDGLEKFINILDVLEVQGNLIEDISVLAPFTTIGIFTADRNPLGTTIERTSENCPDNALSSSVRSFCTR